MQNNDAPGKARFYLADALQKTKTLSPGPPTDLFLRLIALAQAHLGDIPAALRIAGYVKGNFDKQEAHSDIAKIQAQGGDINGALHTANLKSASERDETIAAIVKVQCQADGIAAAEHTVQNVQGDDAKAEALREIAAAQAQSGDIDAAVHTVAEIRKLENWPDNTAWLAVGDIAKAQTLAGDVSAGLRRATDIPDFFRKEDALYACGVALANAGNVPAALRFADAIKNVSATRGLAGDKTDRLFYAAQRRQRDDSEISLLCAIAAAEIKAGKVGVALAQADRIRQMEKDESHLPGIVRALAQTGNIPAAKRLSASFTNIRWKDLATRYLSKAQAEAGDITGALKTVKEIQNPVWRSDTIGDVVQIQAQSGDITGALRLAESMNQDTYQANAIGEIAAKQMLAGSEVEAKKTLSLLGPGLPRIEGDLAVAQVLIGDSVKENGDE